MSVAILATDLVRRFEEVEAVRGVSLEVEEGEIFGFLGPNGAGKSTTVRILTTLLEPTSGSGSVLGHDVVQQAATVRRSPSRPACTGFVAGCWPSRSTR